ncbi:hypothetical protein L218DRAFT_959421 [Marasmius fiardii PR-910]|nr:hypothetical protein L218DRAFT_959421 [Marasmius fiardii PR-910]
MIGPREMEGAKSTKQLIHRYESLHSSHFISKPTSSPSVFKRLSSLATKTDKSAVRQSFRNLMGLLKKANNKLKTEHSHQKKYIPDLTVAEDKPLSVPLPMDRGASQSSASSTGSTRSGLLLYLSRVQYHSWISCFATLEETQILLSWTTGQEPDQHPVPLQHCIDVRSLDHSQMDVDDITLLPRIEGDQVYKVFEIVYQDQSREIFAVTSTRERARWVSCIWDAVLSTQEAKNASRQPLFDQTLQQSTLDTTKPLPDVHERDLPVIPVEPLHVTRSEPSTYNASPDIIHAEATVLSARSLQANNPPIANLSDCSALEQCLTRTETRSSYHSLRLAKSLSSQRSIGTLDPNLMQRLDSQQSVGQDSIIDAYHGYFEQAEPAPPLHSIHSLVVSSDLQAVQDHLTRLADREQLDEKFLSLQTNVHNIPKELTRAMNSGNEHITSALERISLLVSNVGGQTSNTHATLQSIEQKLQGIEAHTKEQVLRDGRLATNHSDNTEILQALEALKRLLASEVAQVSGKLEDVAKLSATLSRRVEPPSLSASSPSQVEVAEILKILKEEETRRIAQDQQRADSVRYLNELNTWLEAFVNNGTSHIHGMSASLKRLCDALGFDADGSNQGQNLLAEVHQLVQNIRVREQHVATLQETVNSIAIHLNSSVGHTVTPQTLAQMMNKHQRDHEVLLKALTEELSQEIRGERLRFVEAMKEATAINVQMHVEEFKKELKREVQGMTQEVSRLYQEKQTMENQIAELFAFHSKQRGGNVRGINGNHIPPDYGGIPRFLASPGRG